MLFHTLLLNSDVYEQLHRPVEMEDRTEYEVVNGKLHCKYIDNRLYSNPQVPIQCTNALHPWLLDFTVQYTCHNVTTNVFVQESVMNTDS